MKLNYFCSRLNSEPFSLLRFLCIFLVILSILFMNQIIKVWVGWRNHSTTTRNSSNVRPKELLIVLEILVSHLSIKHLLLLLINDIYVVIFSILFSSPLLICFFFLSLLFIHIILLIEKHHIIVNKSLLIGEELPIIWSSSISIRKGI